MNIFSAGIESRIVGDLYSLQQLIFDSRIGPNRYYFKLEEGSFERPSFFIKLVTSSIQSPSKYYRDIVSEIMVMYFAKDYFDAHVTAEALKMLLSGAPGYADVVLPRYDFSTLPPTKYSVSGYDEYGKYVGDAVMGARIDSATVTDGGIIQEDNRGWNVPVTFTMTSPMPTYPDQPTIMNVDFEFLSGVPILPQILQACVRSKPSVEVQMI